MSGFRFRLETLLKLRVRRRDERHEALAKAVQAEQIVADRVRNVAREIEEGREIRRGELQAAELNVDRLLRGGGHEMLLRAERTKLEQQLRQIGDELERRRAALVEADREVKMLERLKEKRQEAHETRIAQQETRMLTS